MNRFSRINRLKGLVVNALGDEFANLHLVDDDGPTGQARIRAHIGTCSEIGIQLDGDSINELSRLLSPVAELRWWICSRSTGLVLVFQLQ